MDESCSSRNTLEQLAEEFAERYRQGDRPPLSEYTRRYPQYADDIRELFPALLMLENLKPVWEDQEHQSPTPPLKAGQPERLGDFRILREIGRGGMGIVYEAEQESLGRRVALKVLSQNWLVDPKHQKRFEQEARAAARLHHTNIVPVFGVGEHEGLHYYAMQFIPGLGLDEVLAEIRRLRQLENSNPPFETREKDKNPARKPVSAVVVAELLISGCFERTPWIFEGEDHREQPLSSATTGKLETGPENGAAAPDSSDVVLDPTSVGRLSETGPILLPGQSEDGSKPERRGTYWKSIARIGTQAAEALEYAHSQGILHRDIKPSNLLLDPRGTVWIADFGLAKADDQPDLTHTGDIVGTIRYMAPEMFGGKADARSDIYSLGLTLYELLALQPAFDTADRRTLVRQVMDETPPRLRMLAPAIPRDLETIVHKAIDRDPAQRYQSTAELAAELQRFLSDEPIQARPISSVARLGRWCRRKPALAGLMATLALLLTCGIVVSSLAAVHFDRLAQREMETAGRERDARLEAEHTQQAAETARSEAETARKKEESYRLRAEANFRRAKTVVDDYLTKVSENELLSVPGLQPLRRELLASALTFYEEFLKEQGDDPSLQLDLATAYLRVGKIFNEFAEYDRSAPALRQAQTIYRSLIAANPDDLSLQAGLADVVFAAHAYDEAMILWKKLVEADPAHPRFRRELAQTYNMIALRYDKSQSADSLELHEKALALREVLAREFPDDAESHVHLGQTLNNIGLLLDEKGQHEQALAMYRRGVEHSQIAYRQAPQVVSFGRTLAVGHGNVANMEWRSKRQDEAIAASAKSLAIYRRLAEENPALPYLQSYLATACLNLAFFHREAGNHAESDITVRQARDVLEKLPKKSCAGFYFLACLRARCAEMVGRGKSKLTPDEQAERRREGDLAMDALWRAVAAGHIDPDLTLQDEDLASLRERDDFQQLLAMLRTDPQANLTAKLRFKEESLSEHKENRDAETDGKLPRSDLAASHHAIGLIQSELGLTDKALASLNEALALRKLLIEAAPENGQFLVDLAGIHFALGDVFWKAARLSEAEAASQAALTQLRSVPQRELAGPLVEKQGQLVDRYARLGLWAEAVASQVALAEFYLPGQTYRQYCLALLYAHTGQHEEYNRLCGELLARYDGTDDPNREVLFWIVKAGLLRPAVAVDLQRLEEAVQSVAETQEKSDLRATRWLLKPMMDYRAGRYAVAVEGLRNGIEEFKGPVTARYYLAMAQSRLGRGDDARRLLRSAEEVDQARLLPDGAESIENWEQWLARDMVWREAYGLIDGKPAPDSLHLRLLRARAYAKFGRIDQMHAELKAAMAIEPDNPQLWITSGRLRAELGDHAGSETDFARAAKHATEGITPFLKAGWWIVGPYPRDLKAVCPPEQFPDPSIRPTGMKQPAGAPRLLDWRVVGTSDQGQVDLRATFNLDNVSGYALTYVGSPTERETTFLLGGDDQVRLWVNGELVYETMQLVAPAADRVRVKLRPGRNTLLVKVSNGPSHHNFVLREESPLDLARARIKVEYWAGAAEEFSKALDALPHNRSWWNSPRRKVYLELAAFPEVFAEIVELRPDDSFLWIGRARYHASRNQWEMAIADYKRGLNPERLTEAHHEYACALLLQGDREGYRRLCAQWAERSPEPQDAPAFVLSRLWVLGPEPSVEPAKIIKFAEHAVASGQNAWSVQMLGMAYYRAGDYERAIEKLTESNGLKWDGRAGYARNHLVLAMAHHRLGRNREAREWLAKAVPTIDEFETRFLAQVGGLPPHSCLTLLVLRREAESLLNPVKNAAAVAEKKEPAMP